MHTDIIDQLDHLIASGIVDRQKVGIFGGSFGGYEALVAITTTPDRFACAVDLAGPSDLASFIPIWWENFISADNMAYKSIILGDPLTVAGQASLRASSPLTFVHQAKNPVAQSLEWA